MAPGPEEQALSEAWETGPLLRELCGGDGGGESGAESGGAAPAQPSSGAPQVRALWGWGVALQQQHALRGLGGQQGGRHGACRRSRRKGRCKGAL